MPPTIESLGIDRMTVPERVALVQAIWDSIAAEAEAAPLTEAQKEEIDRRLAADQMAHPQVLAELGAITQDTDPLGPR